MVLIAAPTHPLFTDLFLFCYERESLTLVGASGGLCSVSMEFLRYIGFYFMLSLSYENQTILKYSIQHLKIGMIY